MVLSETSEWISTSLLPLVSYMLFMCANIVYCVITICISFCWTINKTFKNIFVSQSLFCYLRPVLALGDCHCLCLSVSVCVSIVYQSLACLHINLRPVQTRIAKFGPKMQNTSVKFPFLEVGWWVGVGCRRGVGRFGWVGWGCWVLGENPPWPSRSNLT